MDIGIAGDAIGKWIHRYEAGALGATSNDRAGTLIGNVVEHLGVVDRLALVTMVRVVESTDRTVALGKY